MQKSRNWRGQIEISSSSTLSPAGTGGISAVAGGVSAADLQLQTNGNSGYPVRLFKVLTSRTFWSTEKETFLIPIGTITAIRPKGGCQ